VCRLRFRAVHDLHGLRPQEMMLAFGGMLRPGTNHPSRGRAGHAVACLTADDFGDRPSVSTREALRTAEEERRDVCAVCGVSVDSEDIEDTNGWRWFSDGRGGLLPLCPDCPVPEPLAPPEAAKG
jgi:hypothetical protein